MQGDQAGSGYLPDPDISSFFGQNVDFRASRDCPRNFIIFDRMDNRSQIMYNPATTSKFGYFPDTTTTTLVQKDENAPGVMNEDMADIDALLSFEDEEEEQEEDDTSDTCDSWCSRPRNGGPGVLSGHGSKGILGKREKMWKMVKSIRGIVPGGSGNGMNTVDVLDEAVDVLDEAVKYLKSLKVEAQKIGFRDL